MKYCRLCGAEGLTPLVKDAEDNQWWHCRGCGSEQSSAISRPHPRADPYPDRLECVPGPIRFLSELHARTPLNDRVRLETLAPGQARPGLLHLLSPAFLEKTLVDLGFRVLSRPRTGADPQVWELQKVDGL